MEDLSFAGWLNLWTGAAFTVVLVLKLIRSIK